MYCLADNFCHESVEETLCMVGGGDGAPDGSGLDGATLTDANPPLDAVQLMGSMMDGVARHSPEGYGFQQHAQAVGFRQAVRERDEPFGDPGPSTNKG